MSLPGLLDRLRAEVGDEGFTPLPADASLPRRAAARIPRAKLLVAAARLRAEGFDYLSFVTCVDRGAALELVCHFADLAARRQVTLKCDLDPAAPAAPSLTPLYATADWNEREVYDLFGVTFDGHPDLRRILTWDGFAGHPLRKNYRVLDDAVAPEFPVAGGGVA